MTAEQRQATLDLLKAGTSAAGFVKATTIMSLESILASLEKNGANVRDPNWYWLTLFGTPSKTGRWGWRIEGHHLSLNFVVDRGKVAAATPAFFGANPAKVMEGDKKGLRTLPEAEDLALELFASLGRGPKGGLQGKVFPEIEQGKPAPNVGKPGGTACRQDDAKAARHALAPIQGTRGGWLRVAVAEMDEVKGAGLDPGLLRLRPGQRTSRASRGPIACRADLRDRVPQRPADSAGNPANHIHSCWRSMNGDFGIPLP